MKKVLCFGDSNTYGYIPGSGLRYDKNTRWTGVLQFLCGMEYKIIEEGCNNRMCFIDSPQGELYTGYKFLPSRLNKDLYAVILALGANDAQKFFDVSKNDFKNGIETLIAITKANSPQARIIVVSPSQVSNDVLTGPFAFQFDETSIERTKWLGQIYEEASKKFGCEFINLDKIVHVSKIDGLHYDKKEHKIIAQAIYKQLSCL